MNKPVALMRKTDITEFCEYNMEMAEDDNPNAFAKWIPLYTHPVKELTDEEIEEVINRTYWVGTEDEIRMKIARAILRKAQGK